MSDETEALVQQAINSLPTALQSALQEVDWRALLEAIAREYQLSAQQQKSFIAEGTMALVGIQSANDLTENLIKEVDVSPNRAKNLENAFIKKVITPVMDAAERHGMTWGTDDAPRVQETASVRQGGEMGEVKIFESNGLIVTSERFVHGSRVVRLDDISGGALPFTDREWKGASFIVAVGLAMLLWGGAFMKLLGLAGVAGGYFFFVKTITHSVVLSANGEGMEIKTASAELAQNVAKAINQGIAAAKEARTRALRDEFSRLPKA